MTNNIRIVFRNEEPEHFHVAWNDFLLQHPQGWFYDLLTLDYYMATATRLHRDLSFVVLEDGHPAGICCLPLELSGDARSVSLNGAHVQAPVCNSPRVERLVHGLVDDLAKEHGAGKIMFFLNPLLLTYGRCFNSLKKHGFIDETSSNFILDLRPDEKTLFAALHRKSHRNKLNKFFRDHGGDHDIHILDQTTPERRLHDLYKHFHHVCAGKQTRPEESFEAQYAMLRQGLALLVVLSVRGEEVGFHYVGTRDDTGVLMSIANNPERENDYPINRLLFWFAFLELKRRGCSHVSIGRPASYAKVSGFGDYCDEPGLAISTFKAHFGADSTPLFRGTRYLDPVLFEQAVDEFRTRVLDQWNPDNHL